MKNAVAARIGVEFFIAAALLGLFGMVNASQAGQSPLPTLVLGVACVGAGLFVRGGTPTSRTVGLAVAAATVAYGVWSLVHHYYLPGSIVATFTLVRLGAAAQAFQGGATGDVQAPYAQTPYPQAPYPSQPVAPDPGGYFGTPSPAAPPAPGLPPLPSPGDPRFG